MVMAGYCTGLIASMPLSQTVRRKTMHTRVVTCNGYQREDGLWDIEGHMVDTKPYAFRNEDRGGFINANEPLHGMWVRLTLDDTFKIHAAEAVTDYSPFKGCPEIANVFQGLVGASIGNGGNRKLKELMGGIQGCTHLTELLGPIATTAFQTIMSTRPDYCGDMDGLAQDRPPYIDTCHMLREDGEVVMKYWPRFYKPADTKE